MGKWYDSGFKEAKDGICDPPMYPGHRSHTDYMEGQKDGEAELAREVDRENARMRGEEAEPI